MWGWLSQLWTGAAAPVGNDKDNKKPPPPPSAPGVTAATPAPSIGEAETSLKQSIGKMNGTIRGLEQRVALKKVEIQATQKKKGRGAALKLIPGLQTLERELEGNQQILENLRHQLGEIQRVELTRVTATAYSVSTKALKGQMQAIDVEEVKSVALDSEMLSRDLAQLNDILAEPIAGTTDRAKLDEYEAEDYLDALMREGNEEEEADDDELYLPDTPLSRPVSGSAAAASSARLAQFDGAQ